MAYVLWRILTKKYAKVRLGIAALPVIPAERRAETPGKEQETWSLAPEHQPVIDESSRVNCATDEVKKLDDQQKDDDLASEETVASKEINREHENRKSQAKKVKNYLRKCKGALSSARDDLQRVKGHATAARRSNRRSASSSWYLEDTTPQLATTKELHDNPDSLFPTRTTSLTRNSNTSPVSPRRFGSESLLDSADIYVDAVDLELQDNSQNILEKIDSDGEKKVDIITDELNAVGSNLFPIGRGDVASLVRSLLGPIYGENLLNLLTRQARDILVCAYHGNLESFVESYLSPATQLLAKIKKNMLNTLGNSEIIPDGWPLTLAGTGLVLHLGELDASALRYGECYLCVRSSQPSSGGEPPTTNVINSEDRIESNEKPLERIIDIVEIALVWKSSMRSPGILHWEREDDFMDWRENQTSSSPSSRHRRRKSRELLSKARDDTSPASSTIQYRQLNAFSPFRVSQEASSVNKELGAMRLDQRATNRHKEEATIQIEDLQNLSCIESAIKNRLQIDESDETSQEELVKLIGTLLVSVERKIERINLDDLVFPCPTCRNIDTDDPLLGCKCTEPGVIVAGHADDSCDCGIVLDASASFEVPGIKHIDSDDEEEVRLAFGTKRGVDDQVPSPRSIHDLPEHVLNCGLRLPGYVDNATGRLVLEFENPPSKGQRICPREIASYLLYLSRLHSSERTKNGWTLVIRCTADDDVFEALDRALVLVQNRVNVRQALVLRNSEGLDYSSTHSQLPRTRVKITSVDDATLGRRISRRRDYEDNHKQWISFYKEYDSLMAEWQVYGRKLVQEMSELRDCENGSLTPLSRLLSERTFRKTSAQNADVLLTLEKYAAVLSHLDYVSCAVQRAKKLIEEVENAETRLERSFEARRATIRNFTVLRNIEEQAREVLSWLCKKGEDILAKHARHTATTLTSARLHERDFEKFYFVSMQPGSPPPPSTVGPAVPRLSKLRVSMKRHLDKGSDLAEVAESSGLNELAYSLREHLRDFGTRLEHQREHLEDTSRCYLLRSRAQEWADDAQIALERSGSTSRFADKDLPDYLDEMMSLAVKLGNKTLLDQCKETQTKCFELSQSIIHSSDGCQTRSFAESNLWEDNDSNIGSCSLDNVPAGGTAGSRPTLDNIAELGEAGQQDSLDFPPQSPPAERRLAKPPVNSHLQRSPSIAPAGMKTKKTILLIMREMIQTERDYVKSLEYIIENYIPQLVREDIPQALRGQRNVIFGNVEKIYEFHSQHFLNELEQCEHSPMMVGQCFLRHENKFYLYALYNKNKPNSDSLMAEYGTAFFKSKQLELGDKMDLASYLLKPVQRMGKYALLLQQLVKAGTDLSHEQAKNNEESLDEENQSAKPVVEGEADLRAAEQMVRFQLRHGNDLLAMDSLRDCDVNVKEQGRLLRQNEFLVWQGKGKKCLRQVFLFEDLVLFSKARRFPDRKNLDIYIYKHSIKTTDIGMTAVMADSPTKFEIWFRKRKPGDTYTLQCASEEIKKAWTEELSNLLWKQALRNREVRLAEMSSMGIGNKPCLDIRPSADQINDRSISVAQLSKTPRFRNSIAVSQSEDSNRCTRRPHSVISVSSSSSSGGSSGGPQTALHLGLEASPRLHHRSTTLHSQCSVESGIIADISIVSDDGVDGNERNHWKSTLESPTSSHLPNTSTPLQSPTSSTVPTVAASTSSSDVHLISPYDQDVTINL